MEINSLKDLQEKRSALQLLHKETVDALDAKNKYFADNKFAIIWDSVSPFGAGEQSRSRVMNFIKASVLPMLGGKGMIISALLPSIETFVSEHAVKGFKKFIGKFKRSPSSKDRPVS